MIFGTSGVLELSNWVIREEFQAKTLHYIKELSSIFNIYELKKILHAVRITETSWKFQTHYFLFNKHVVLKYKVLIS